MRFFKYLVFIFLSLISVYSFSQTFVTKYFNSAEGSTVLYDSFKEACAGYFSKYPPIGFATNTGDVGAGRCGFTRTDGSTGSTHAVISSTQIIVEPKCLPKDYPYHLSFDAGTPIPTQFCEPQPEGSFCRYVVKGDPMILNRPNNQQSALLFSASESPVSTCNNLFDGQCDKTDPYGACYQPPNDGCTRQKDGSIICPDDTPPPQPDNTCNGATYCKRPPQGCGEGYVSGSFNGELLCVKSGPSNPQEPKPDDPTDPDNCKNGGSYCEAPPNDQACPSGYYESTHNGSKICVKNSQNPNEPNPNDPNNNDPNNPPDPNNPNNPNPGDGFDDSGIINAIKALRDSLLGAIGGVSGKLTTLIDGQKETNNHLDDIKKESIKTNGNLTKTNEKLDKSNEHLEKIQESGQAASETLGDIKDFLTEEYEPDEEDSDTKLDVGNISVGEYESNYVTWSAHCPPDQHVQINLMGQNSTLVLSWSPWCELLSKLKWAIIACAYFAAAYIVLGMR